MNKEKVCIIVSAICFMISVLCFVIHVATTNEMVERQNCEHDYKIALDVPLSITLYSAQKMWIPIYEYKCVKCGGVR